MIREAKMKTSRNIGIPIRGGGMPFEPSDEQMDEWVDSNPGVDVVSCLEKAVQWIQRKPEEREPTMRRVVTFCENWLRKEERKVASPSAVADVDHYRCHYTIDGIRCSASGTMCESTGAGGPDKGKQDTRRSLCLAHWRLCGDPLGSREALADLAAHLPKYGDKLQTAWRDMGEHEKRKMIAETVHKARTFVREVTKRPLIAPGPGTVQVGAEKQNQLDALYCAMTSEERAEYDHRPRGMAA